MTWYAQDSLGDLVVTCRRRWGRLTAGEEYGELESVKAVSGVVAPLGAVTEVNQAVIDTPELVNHDPYGQGWLIRVQLATRPSGPACSTPRLGTHVAGL